MARSVSTGRLLAGALLLIVLGLAAYVLLTLPQRPIAITPTATQGRPTLTGVLHVHSDRSDGTGSVDEVAAAAARAGLGFVVLTDHGDATRRPEPPAYRHGVLMIDGVEISADGGHYVALGLPRAPFPLAGEARDVVADVARLGGFGFAAHPGSPKPGLRWRDWAAPVDGIEWVNGDSEWRDEPWPALGRVLVQYFIRAPGALASLLDRPVSVLARWDAMIEHRRVVAVAASDAHARLGLRANTDPYPSGAVLRLPSYEAAFRALSVVVELNAPVTRDPSRDAAAVLAALRAGHVASVVTAIAAPAALEFSASSGESLARAGDLLRIDGPVRLRARIDAPDGATLVLLHDGQPLVVVPGPELNYTAPARPGAYRIEVRVPDAPGEPQIPWVVSNPIYAGVVPLPPVHPGHRPGQPARVLYENGPATGWRIESGRGSVGAVEMASSVGGSQLMFRWGLADGAPSGQFVAAVVGIQGGMSPADRVVFRARAPQPMRLSVQLRNAAAQQGQRWRRSVFLDDVPREITVWFDDLTPAEEGTSYRPDLAQIESLLFVVDTVNTRPGTSGTVYLDDVRTEQPEGGPHQ